MRKGQRARTSFEPEDNQQPWSTDRDSEDHSSTGGFSSDEYSSSDSDLEAERVMKRSQRFSCSLSFGEDQELQSKDEDTEEDEEEEVSPKNSNGVPATELVEAEQHTQLENASRETSQLPRSGVFRPQELWLAMTRCLTLRWPPCLSINRQNNRKLTLQVDLDQSVDTQSSDSSELTNESSSSTSPLDDISVAMVKQEKEDVRNKGVKSGLPPRLGISRSSPRLPRARQASDSMLASLILEKEMFLWLELVDTGEEKDDLRYRAEWKLSERTRNLAEGVWLSRSQKIKD